MRALLAALVTAIRRLLQEQEEPVRLPRTTGWGVCEDCDAPCLLTAQGACSTCSGSSTRPWLDREAAWRAAGCPRAEPVQQRQGEAA